MSKIPEPQLPAPRRARSAFAQGNPAPEESPRDVSTEGNSQARSAPVRRQPDEPRERKEQRSKRMEGTRDILLSMPISQKERMEATIAHTQAFTGVKHQQVFIRTAVERLCEQLEQQYNRGDRYAMPPVDPHL
ncbi:hypothetical protein [Rhodococcoides fascians]|uniref:hypothetical protein n=1 Tax=Rhodococcoides fascians TaxID=1828 RepID=UPI001E467059|nr:hypothetical protein [Rhodococcus fascians]